MTYYVDGAGENKHINYEPSLLGGLARRRSRARTTTSRSRAISAATRPRAPRTTTPRPASATARSQDWERDDLIANLVGDMKQCPEAIQLRMVWHFWHGDEDYGRRVAEGAGIDLEKAKALPPLPGKPAPRPNREGPTYTSGQSEQGGAGAGKEPATSEEVAAK